MFGGRCSGGTRWVLGINWGFYPLEGAELVQEKGLCMCELETKNILRGPPQMRN